MQPAFIKLAMLGILAFAVTANAVPSTPTTTDALVVDWVGITTMITQGDFTEAELIEIEAAIASIA